MDFDEISFLFNEDEINIVGDNEIVNHNKNCSDSRFSITFLRIGITVGANGPMVFLAKGNPV